MRPVRPTRNARRRAVLFGAGVAAEQQWATLSQEYEIVAALDNDPKKHGKVFFNVVIQAPSSIVQIRFDCVLVTCQDATTVVTQLMDLGVGRDRIEQIGHREFQRKRLMKLLGVGDDESKLAQLFEEEYFAERCVYVACPPKCASRIFESVLDLFIKSFGPENQQAIPFTQPSNIGFASNLREVLEAVPFKSCYRDHSGPTWNNVETVELLRLKLFVLLRHPADLIVANYCHHLGILKDSTSVSAMMDTSVTLVDFRAFNSSSMEEGLDTLIRDGFLTELLAWMVKWICYSEKYPLAKVVRYMDYTSGEIAFFENVLEFLFPGQSLRPPTVNAIRNFFDGFLEGRQTLMHRYPNGYTGSVGIWKRYFSQANVDSYNRQTKNFLELYPRASTLLEHYPDLLIDTPSSGKRQTQQTNNTEPS